MPGNEPEDMGSRSGKFFCGITGSRISLPTPGIFCPTPGTLSVPTAVNSWPADTTEKEGAICDVMTARRSFLIPL